MSKVKKKVKVYKQIRHVLYRFFTVKKWVNGKMVDLSEQELEGFPEEACDEGDYDYEANEEFSSYEDVKLSDDLINTLRKVYDENKSQYDRILFTYLSQDYDYHDLPAIVGVRMETDAEYDARMAAQEKAAEKKKLKAEQRKQEKLALKEQKEKELFAELSKKYQNANS